jgi:hypothetical protein
MPAEKSADLQMQEELDPGKRQVGDHAPVYTMHGSRAVPAARTHSGTLPNTELEMQDACDLIVCPQAKAGEVRQQSL